MFKIYFGEKTLVISSTPSAKERQTDQTNSVFNYTESGITAPLEALKNLDIQTATILHTDVNEPLNALKKQFLVILAGGGMVQTHAGEILLIFRKGKWDLPKGKLDEGEDLAQCAVREVQEETGLVAPVLGNKICVSYHTYNEKGKDILKESHWYAMTVPQAQILTPQKEENIEICKWVPIADLNKYRWNMHPSVKDVIDESLKDAT